MIREKSTIKSYRVKNHLPSGFHLLHPYSTCYCILSSIYMTCYFHCENTSISHAQFFIRLRFVDWHSFEEDRLDLLIGSEKRLSFTENESTSYLNLATDHSNQKQAFTVFWMVDIKRQSNFRNRYYNVNTFVCTRNRRFLPG